MLRASNITTSSGISTVSKSQKVLLIMPRLDAKPLYDHFRRLDYNVEQHVSGLYALTMLEHSPPDVIVCHKQTEDVSGEEFVEIIRSDASFDAIGLLAIADVNQMTPYTSTPSRTVLLPRDSDALSISKATLEMLATTVSLKTLQKPAHSSLLDALPVSQSSLVPSPPLRAPNQSAELNTTSHTPLRNTVSQKGVPHSTSLQRITPEDTAPQRTISKRTVPSEKSSRVPPVSFNPTTEVNKNAGHRSKVTVQPQRFGIDNAQIRGNLKSISLFDLFNTLLNNQKTGRLCIRRPSTDALLTFEEGQLRHAIYGAHYGEAALEIILRETLDAPNTPFFFGHIRVDTAEGTLESIHWHYANITKTTPHLIQHIASKLASEQVLNPRTVNS